MLFPLLIVPSSNLGLTPPAAAMEYPLYELTPEGLESLRRRTPYTVVDLYHLFRLVLAGNVTPLKAQICKLAAGTQ